MMKNKFNNLLKYIYDYSAKEQRRETISDLFRSVLEPVIQNQKIDACVFLRIFDKDGKQAVLQRLAASSLKIYGFCSEAAETGVENCLNEDIWDSTEFLAVLSSRYSALLMWDYASSEQTDYTKVCLLYNSRVISDIAKLIADNSKEYIKSELKELVKKYMPDRRENSLMNKSIQAIAAKLNDKTEENIFSEYEKRREKKVNAEFDISADDAKDAEIIKAKAKYTAHEINNYLSVINIYSQTAKRHLEAALSGIEPNSSEAGRAESVLNALKNISGASDNISRLISDLRCMSKARKEEVNLKKLLLGAIEMHKAKAETMNARLHEGNILDINVKTDKVKIQCAVSNIIINALEAEARNIYISADEHSILIRNDGALIPMSLRNKIFEADFTTKEKGSGLGLAFCRQELRTMNGDIQLVSSDEKETVFVIKF